MQGLDLQVTYGKGLDDLKVFNQNGEIELGKKVSIDRLIDLEIANLVSQELQSNIKSNKYTSIIDDAKDPYKIKGVRYTAEVDMRSREFDYKSFVSDLRTIKELLPESISDEYIKKLTEKALDKTFGFTKNGNNRSNFEKQASVIEIYDLVSKEILEMTKSKSKDSLASKELEENLEKMNSFRKERVEKSSATTIISFETKEAEQAYMEQSKVEARKKRIQERMAKKEKEEAEKRELEEKVGKFDYSGVYEYIGKKELQFTIKGVMTTSDIRDSDTIFHADILAAKMKDFLMQIPSEKQDEVFDTVFNDAMTRAFGVSQKEVEPDTVEEKAFHEMYKTVKSNVFFDTEIDLDVIKQGQEILNENHRRIAEENKKHTAVWFKDEQSRKAYDAIIKITKSQVATQDFSEELKNLIDLINLDAKGKNQDQMSQ